MTFAGTPRIRRDQRPGRAGNAVVELAIMAPLLMLLVFGAGDFARIFYAGVEISNGATAGALYGSYSPSHAIDTAGISQAVKNDTQNLKGVTVSSTTFCECSDGSGIACTSMCAGGVGPRFFVKVTASYSFQPLISYTGLPGPKTISKVVTMRVR